MSIFRKENPQDVILSATTVRILILEITLRTKRSKGQVVSLLNQATNLITSCQKKAANNSVSWLSIDWLIDLIENYTIQQSAKKCHLSMNRAISDLKMRMENKFEPEHAQSKENSAEKVEKYAISEWGQMASICRRMVLLFLTRSFWPSLCYAITSPRTKIKFPDPTALNLQSKLSMTAVEKKMRQLSTAGTVLTCRIFVDCLIAKYRLIDWLTKLILLISATNKKEKGQFKVSVSEKLKNREFTEIPRTIWISSE